MITPWPKTPLKHIPETRVNAEGLGAGSVWLKTLVIGHIKLASVNYKHINFYRCYNFEEIVEDIGISKIADKLDDLNIDPATAAS